MRLTDFLASVGGDFNLQDRFWHSEAPKLADDTRFQQLLGRNGWNNLDPKHRDLLKEGDLAKIHKVLIEEAQQGGGGSSAEVTAHQAGGFGPSWVLVRV